VHYPVELQVAASVWKGAPPFINVEVKCPSTGQVYTVPVRIQKGDQSGNYDIVTSSYVIIRAVPNILFVFYSVRIVGRIVYSYSAE